MKTVLIISFLTITSVAFCQAGKYLNTNQSRLNRNFQVEMPTKYPSTSNRMLITVGSDSIISKILIKQPFYEGAFYPPTKREKVRGTKKPLGQLYGPTAISNILDNLFLKNLIK